MARMARGVSSRRPSRCSMRPASSSIRARSRSRSSERAASSPSSSRARSRSTSASSPGCVADRMRCLERVEVAERVEQARHVAELHRVVATERLRALPRQVRERLLQVARELVDLPPQVHVFEQRLGERLELRALLGRHRVEQLLHLRHRLRHLLEQLVEVLRVAGEELAVPLHERHRSRAPHRARAVRASG